MSGDYDKFVESLSTEQLVVLKNDWRFWARPEQLMPEGEWSTFIPLGGRGVGKTRMGAEFAHVMADKEPGNIGALAGPTAADIRDYMIHGDSGLLATQKPWNPCQHMPSQKRVQWANGSYALYYYASEPDQGRGPNTNWVWADEVCKWRYLKDLWQNLTFANRRGRETRKIITTTPKPIPAFLDILNGPGVVQRVMSTIRNALNLAADFLRDVWELYAGTRIGLQELFAQILLDNPDALWSRELLTSTRVERPHPTVERTAIGVDPPGGEITECGIVGGIRCQDKQGYVVADRSLSGKPERWAKAIWDMATWMHDEYSVPPRIMVETNHGGLMVESTLNTARPAGCHYKIETCHASVGKYARAEPLHMLYEQHRFHHVGEFGALEGEMTQWNPLEANAPSPNRLDALVWMANGLGMISTKRRRMASA